MLLGRWWKTVAGKAIQRLRADPANFDAPNVGKEMAIITRHANTNVWAMGFVYLLKRAPKFRNGAKGGKLCSGQAEAA